MPLNLEDCCMTINIVSSYFLFVSLSFSSPTSAFFSGLVSFSLWVWPCCLSWWALYTSSVSCILKTLMKQWVILCFRDIMTNQTKWNPNQSFNTATSINTKNCRIDLHHPNGRHPVCNKEVQRQNHGFYPRLARTRFHSYQLLNTQWHHPMSL